MIELNLKIELINIKLEIELGTINAIFGKSGAGKSTILNILAGIYNLDNQFKDFHCFVKFADEVWLDTKSNIFCNAVFLSIKSNGILQTFLREIFCTITQILCAFFKLVSALPFV